jgi:hypothetical protein
MGRKLKTRYGLQIKVGMILITIALLAMHLFVVLNDTHFHVQGLGWLSNLFDLDKEYNIPTAYSSFLLIVAGILCGSAAIKKRLKGPLLVWLGLAGIFLYLAFDEYFIIHEQLATKLREVLVISNGSVFFHAWVIPALIVVIVLGIYLVINIAKHRSYFARSKIIWLVFALGAGTVLLEMIGTQLFKYPLAYRLGSVAAEEIFEISLLSSIVHHLLLINRAPRAKKLPHSV